jgi:hypothetical protein
MLNVILPRKIAEISAILQLKIVAMPVTLLQKPAVVTRQLKTADTSLVKEQTAHLLLLSLK